MFWRQLCRLPLEAVPRFGKPFSAISHSLSRAGALCHTQQLSPGLLPEHCLLQVDRRPFCSVSARYLPGFLLLCASVPLQFRKPAFPSSCTLPGGAGLWDTPVWSLDRPQGQGALTTRCGGRPQERKQPCFRSWYMSQNKHAEARELMCSGALLFFSHGQQNSAADLSMLVLESLEKADVEVADELLENLAKLFSLMDPNSPERVAFVSRALKWSSGGSGKLGHPRLHQLLALTLWKEQNYCESRYHFLHSTDGEGCANMLVEYSTSRGFRSEVDMFVAQAVLQFLCLKNKSSASVVFTTYTQKHPSIENGPPFVQPLLNFIWFLLLAVDGGKLTVFTVLCEQYQPSLRRDPMYNEYLDRIGQLFFGVPPKQTSSYGGLLGNLLSSLMGSSEQEGEDSQDDSSPIELD
ncbi:Golgi to ER traffic protein 4 homolog isoform X1 [Diceros bicornis minor]|uniref:Golgi to ER traffic protein 4 homolog isoform X1 n=2 Tax=Diceros bicornis minor TaxID=77932 RepID=UPI0026F1379D|nr:Golgi to ER traffic protein 4 homolog isoform X1 [Diceros bicornis minor]